MVLASKLMKAPAILSNTEAVKAYLVPMSRRLVEAIHTQLQQTISRTKLMSRRREDPYLLQEVMEASESPDFGSSLDTFYGVGQNPNGPLGNPFSSESYSRGSLTFPFAPQIPQTMPTAPVKMEPKQEQFEQIMAGMALIKDTINVNKKETSAVLDSHQKSISSLMGMLKANAENSNRSGYAAAQSNPPQNKVPDWGQGCFMCGSLEHRISDCQFFNTYKEKGWLVQDTAPGSKKYTLRDGSPLPRNDPNESRPEKIARIAKAKGWDKGGSNAFFVEEDDFEESEEQGPHYMSFMNTLAKAMAEHEAASRNLARSNDPEESGN